MKQLKSNIVPVGILVLAVISFILSGVSFNFLSGEVYARFIRNTLFVLALVLPIQCGMGINFAIVVGAICAQASIVMAIDLQLAGFLNIGFIVVVSILLSILCGGIVAIILNIAKGREMIVSIVIGQLSAVIYQLIFMVMYGIVLTPKNPDILLASGIGVRNSLASTALSDVMKSALPISIDGKIYSLLPLIIIFGFTMILYYIKNSRLGTLAEAVGSNPENATKLGIDNDRVKMLCIIISTIFAAIGQILFVADLGSIKVYTGHLNIDILAAAAILVGGASIKKANIRNCFLGIILFHSLFITSSMAGQNLFSNPSVGEYFRSFLAYGVIVISIVLNISKKKMTIDL